jgi:PAS domain S-box-containing protein
MKKDNQSESETLRQQAEEMLKIPTDVAGTDVACNVSSEDKIQQLIYDLEASQVELELQNQELTFQNEEKEKRAAELVIANKELAFQNEEKGKRAAELKQKKSEEKLKIDYNYARSLIEASLDPLLTIDAEGKITDVNLATENAIGLSRDSLIGTDFSDYFTEPEKAKIGYQNVFAEGNVIDYPLTIRHKSNRHIDVLYNANVFRNEQGEIIGVFAAARDITARRQAELLVQEKTEVIEAQNEEYQQINEELTQTIIELQTAREEAERSGDRYRNLLTNLETGIVVHAPDTSILTNNPRASVILGLSDDQMKGKTAIDREWKFVTENNVPLALEEYPVNRIVSDRKPIKEQILGIRQPGKNDIVWVTVNGFPALNIVGEITEIVISFNDITEHKAAEEELILKNLIFESSIAANSISNIDGIITHCNTAFLKIWGYDSSDEVIGKPIPLFIKNEDEALKIVTSLNESGAWQGEYTGLKKDRTIFNAYGLATIVQNKQKEIIGYFSAVIDITDRKLAEEQIHRLNAELEQRVLHRTTKLESINKELAFQNQEKAKRAAELVIANIELVFQNEEKEKRAAELVIANKRLEAFSYSVSHDLRAPLRHIEGYVDLLLNRFYDTLPDKAKHYLDNIADSSRQMGILIDDLLQFSRTGRQEMWQAGLDMNSIVQEVLDAIKQDNPNRNIEWQIAALPVVYGDQSLLRLVWTNLLSNAVKFTRTREKAIIAITVRDEKDEFIFAVTDNGVGFDMQYAQKLFGVFQRLHPTDEFEGTGIGLANVRGIITRHGGRTWAESEPDKGATFYFSILKTKYHE